VLTVLAIACIAVFPVLRWARFIVLLDPAAIPAGELPENPFCKIDPINQ
jgi:hypothetical protein